MARPVRKHRGGKVTGSRKETPAYTWLRVHRRQLATILAALRFHRDENVQGTGEIPDKHIQRLATDCGNLRPLDFDEITTLCRRLSAATRSVHGRSRTCPACGRSVM